MGPNSALLGLIPGINFVDHVNPALAAHDPASPVTGFERLKGGPDFHDTLRLMVWALRAEIGSGVDNGPGGGSQLSAHLMQAATHLRAMLEGAGLDLAGLDVRTSC